MSKSYSGHVPVRVPAGWTDQNKTMVIQINNLIDDLYRRVNKLQERADIEVDQSLTIPNVAADSKVTGDRLGELSRASMVFHSVEGLSSFKITDIPVNHYTYTQLSTNHVFTELPEGISQTALVNIKREPLNDLRNVSIVTVYDVLSEITFRATYRAASQSISEYLWPWKKILNSDDKAELIINQKNLNIRTCNIFNRVLCVGDSYTAGWINTSGTGSQNKDYSWPHYMEILTGNKWVNCGISGASSKTWMENANGLQAAQSAGLVQAYIVMLMINDALTPSVKLNVGEPEDMDDVNPTTYYGCYAKLIRELHNISEDAIIFVCTCPFLTIPDGYQNAVRYIAQAYADDYNVHLLDMKQDSELFKNPTLVGDYINIHYTALGYEQFAEIYAYYISNYINNHIPAFQNVYKIPYDQ